MGLRSAGWTALLGLAVIAVGAGAPRGGFAERAFAGDEAPAGLVVDVPADGALVGRDVVVRGRVGVSGKDGEAQLRVNGEDVPTTAGGFEKVLHATADGPFRVRVLYAAIGAPAEVVDRTVQVDATPPVLTIFEPAQETQEYAGAEALIRGTVVDAHLRDLKMNGH